MARSNLPVGLTKGHPTTAIAQKPKPSNRKGKKSARSSFVKSIVREVAGFAPYERRVMELIRNSKVRAGKSFSRSHGSGWGGNGNLGEKITSLVSY
ncbi:ribosomal protein L36e [Meredithblackwellia eburnea MCA 4105]